MAWQGKVYQKALYEIMIAVHIAKDSSKEEKVKAMSTAVDVGSKSTKVIPKQKVSILTEDG